MGLVLSLFPAKVDISSRSGRLPGPVLWSETLVTCPSFDQRSVHGEMFIRQNRSRITSALLNFVITWTTKLRRAIRAILAFSPFPPLAKPAGSAPELAELSEQSEWSVPGS